MVRILIMFIRLGDNGQEKEKRMSEKKWYYAKRAPQCLHMLRKAIAPRYEGYHRYEGRGGQVLTCKCHMCTTNELSACFWVNTLMIAMGGNFFLICVVYYWWNILATIYYSDEILSIALYHPNEKSCVWRKVTHFYYRDWLWMQTPNLLRSSCDKANPIFDLKIYLIWLKRRVDGTHLLQPKNHG